MLHAALSHLPIALSILGLPLIILALIAPKSHTIRWLAIAAYLALMLTAFLAAQAGEQVEGNVPYDAPAEVIAELDNHEWFAERIWILGSIVAACMLGSFIPHDITRRLTIIIALLASITTAGWVAIAAHHGGRLVYIHSIGTPGNKTPGSPGSPGTPGDNTQNNNTTSDDNNSPDDSDNDDNTSEGETSEAEGDTSGGEGETSGGGGLTSGGGVVGDLTDPAHPFAARFALQISTLLEDRCFSCHNPRRRGGPRGGLDLTTIASLLKGGETGPAIIPGDAEKSLLIIATTYDDPFLQMPPKEEDRLTAEEIDILRHWVNSITPQPAPIDP